MHVATLLYAKMFRVTIGQRIGGIEDVFPDWQSHDRFGLVIDTPLGGLGASHLLQLAITGFYDAKPSRRAERRIYPEIYAFHAGRGFGSHADFDFWPARREIIVTGSHRELLDAINDRGITRLAVPDRPWKNLDHRPKEAEAAMDRLRTAVIYSADGRTRDADFSITGLDRRTELNPSKVLRPMQVTPEMARQAKRGDRLNKEVEAAWIQHLLRHQDDVTSAERDAAATRRQAISSEGCVTESYRFAEIPDVLGRLEILEAAH